MKKLLLGLGAIASVAAPVAAVVACGSTTIKPFEAPSFNYTSVTLDQSTQGVFGLGFTFGLKSSDVVKSDDSLNSGFDFSSDMKKRLNAAGILSDHVRDSIVAIAAVDKKAHPEFDYIASSNVLVIADKTDKPTEEHQQALIKNQLKLGGIGWAFYHDEVGSVAWASVTTAALNLENHGDKLLGQDNFEKVDEFQPIAQAGNSYITVPESIFD